MIILRWEKIVWDVHDEPLRLEPAMSCWTVLLSNSEASLELWTERVPTKKEAPALVETFKLGWLKFAKPSGEKFYG